MKSLCLDRIGEVATPRGKLDKSLERMTQHEVGDVKSIVGHQYLVLGQRNTM